MRLLLILTILVFFSPTKAQVLFQFKGNNVTTWTYTDGDEFNDTQYNSDFWHSSYPWSRYLYCSKDLSYYSENGNLVEKDGIIKIIAKKENITAKAIPYEPETYVLKCDYKPDAKNLMDFNYTSGLLFSKKKFLYGMYEIRFRVDEHSGLWPAFWLFEGKGNEEIDIFEIPGKDPGKFHVDVHCPTGCNNYHVGPLGLFRTNWGGMISTNGFWSKNYNIIGIEWQAGYIKWYLNGEPIAYWKGKFPNPMSFIANLAVTSDDGNFSGNPVDSIFPVSMDIDYIRVWHQHKSEQLKTDNRFALSGNTSSLTSSTANAQTMEKPIYKSSQLKEPQRLVSIIRSSPGNLLIQDCGNIKIGGKAEIKDNQDKTIKTIQLDKPFINLSLADLTTGNYKLLVQIGRISATATFEVK